MLMEPRWKSIEKACLKGRRGIARLLLVSALLASACSPGRRVGRFADNQLAPPYEPRQFTGLLMVDAQNGRTLYALNADKAFTPASNTKLFTLYAALKTLPDRVPALKYVHLGDTLVVVGTGNPAALHPDLADSTALAFMRGFPLVAMANDQLADPVWGPGWAWDDYDQYYTPSRSAFPIHGNMVRLVTGARGLQVSPSLFQDSLQPGKQPFARAMHRNRFYQTPGPGDTLDLPIRTSPELERRLWSDALGKPLFTAHVPPGVRLEVLPGIASDTLYKKMMTESDNFIAEQLMLAVASTLGDTLSFESARDTVLKKWLPGLPQAPRWVDGSGLSRYNQFSPASLVYLLQQMHREFSEPRLFALLARGGEAGTLRDWYRDEKGPYLFGKTGSLSGVNNLSGYLKTRSGKTVVFSFMNNNFTGGSQPVKARMERILNWVRDHY